MEISLRPAEYQDIEKIFVWRNDPEVRRNSINQDVIHFNEHVEYWKSFLGDKSQRAYIITCEDNDVGIVKLKHVDENTNEVDIIISKEFRSKGIARRALEKVKEEAFRMGINKLIAKIKPDNISSIKSFEKSGFVSKLVHYEVMLE